MQLTFSDYEHWMKDQVIEMFCAEYGNEKQQFADYFDLFYSGFQENKAIRLVILDDKIVAGFVSFSYWPYIVNGKVANSYQCGNVIISKNYRGKGLYNQLLDYLNVNAFQYKIDFIIGFPIKQILKLYLKSKWKNPFNVNWYVKINNPIGKLFKINENTLERIFSSDKKCIDTFFADGRNVLKIDQEFYLWNKNYNNIGKHFYFYYADAENKVEFSLKINKRKYLNELIIGEVNANTVNLTFLAAGFKALDRRIRRIAGVSMISICLNDNDATNPIYKSIIQCRFRKIDRDIKFIVNNFTMNEDELLAPQNWQLFRRDIDTW
jgi:hypothetical protein